MSELIFLLPGILYYCILICLIYINSLVYSEQIKENILLKVSDIEITHYEFEKNLQKYKDQFKRNHSKIAPQESILVWVDEFIDKTYILAEAYRIGYHKKSEVERDVKKVEYMIITQTHGLLYTEKITKNIQIDEEKIKDARENMRKKITIKYLKFKDSVSMEKNFTGDISSIKLKNFNDMYTKNIESIEKDELQLIWPLWKFWELENTLYSLKENEISEPIPTNDGIYIVYIKKIEQIEKNPLEDDEAAFEELLKRYEEIKLESMYINTIHTMAKTKIYDTIAIKMMDIIMKNKNLYLLNQQDFNTISDEVVLSYTNNSKIIDISVSHFIDYYNNSILRRHIKNIETLYEYLREVVYNDYTYQEAIQLGLTETKKFILDRKNYKNSVIYNLYERNELMGKISVDNEELITEYRSRKESLKDGTDAIVSVFTFNSFDSAIMGRSKILTKSHYYLLKEPEIKNFIPELENYFISKKLSFDNTEYSPEINEIIFSMKDNSCSQPVMVNNYYLVFLKESEYGERIRSFEEAKKDIERIVRDKKLQKLKKELVVNLKKKYTIENNIDLNTYVNTLN